MAGITGKLGCNRTPEEKLRRTLCYATYREASRLPAVPDLVDQTMGVVDWRMMGNDVTSDCEGGAVPGHAIMNWTARAGKMITPTDADLIAAYSAISGYDPNATLDANGDNPTDVGCNPQEVLNYWRTTGIAGHKIGAYVALEVGNEDHLLEAIYLFGGVNYCMKIPDYAMKQDTWHVPIWNNLFPARILGGHGTWINWAKRGGDRKAVTWGMLKEMTKQFCDKYAIEIYAILSEDQINPATGKSPEGFDMTALMADLKAVTA